MAPQSELRRYPESASACLVKGMLAQEGIPATVHRVSRYQGMGGSGYVLRVDAQDLARAEKLIHRADTEVDLDEYVDADDRSYRRCPQCHSVMVSQAPLGWGQRMLALITLGLTYILLEKAFQCQKCGASWRGR